MELPELEKDTIDQKKEKTKETLLDIYKKCQEERPLDTHKQVADILLENPEFDFSEVLVLLQDTALFPKKRLTRAQYKRWIDYVQKLREELAGKSSLRKELSENLKDADLWEQIQQGRPRSQS